ncbi:cuticle collagen 2C-like [Motacilla alba alba]|uniref:cuticle collagen 2C-like n=1 Tax=Motacilla alba alba TaxID=1094192 RepID=UPI0018D57BE0|nr:cuticle collagen 2C-like [Motacilla alba alba]
MGTGGPPGADSSPGIRGLHGPMAMLTAAPRPKVPFVPLLSRLRHHVAVCSAALEMALPPPSPWGFHPPELRHVSGADCAPGSADRAATGARPPSAPCPRPRGRPGRPRSDRSRAGEPGTGAAAAPGQPGLRDSPSRCSAQLRLRVPRFRGTRDEDTSQAPPSEAALPLLCWLALGDL